MRLLALAGSLVVMATTHAMSSTAIPSKDVLRAPRLGSPVVNPNGSYAIFSVDQLTDDLYKVQRKVYRVDTITASKPELLFETSTGATSFVWISNDRFIYQDGPSIYESDILHHAPKHLFDLPTPSTNLQYDSTTGTLAWTAEVWRDGDFTRAKPDVEVETQDTGVMYDELAFRVGGSFRDPQKMWTIATTQIRHFQPVNVLNATGLISLIEPIDFTISNGRIAFTVPPAGRVDPRKTRKDVYVLSPGSSQPVNLTPHDHGGISSLHFSPDSEQLVWLEIAEDGYEAGRNTIVTYDRTTRQTTAWNEGYGLEVNDVIWSTDSESLYAIGLDRARILPYYLKSPGHISASLTNLSVSTIVPVTERTVLLTPSSLTRLPDLVLLDVHATISKGDAHRQLTNYTHDYFGNRLESIDVDELWFKGADDKDVMTFVLKPPGFQSGQKHSYPMVFYIHGGPQSAWFDNWNVRWNKALFASQGYIVVGVNFAGSTSYGQSFTDSIREEWGGRAFKDLLTGYQAVLERYPEIDPERTAGVGPSFGGYMINWINGHNEEFKFKTLVCHAGVFDTSSFFYTTAELALANHDFAGTPYVNKATFDRWNPANFVSIWETPTLVSHGGKDSSLSETEGFAAFTALQLRGVPSRLLYFPDEDHAISSPNNVIRWHQEVFAWIDQWLGGTQASASVEAKTTFVIQA